MSESRDPLVGALIAGRYAIERKLGMGGMGAVYLASQASLGRSVALKVLRGELVGDAVAVERFKNEARLIAQLGHPHVVGIHDFGTTDDGMLYIAMEFLPGRTLAETVRVEGPLSWQRSLPIVRDVARALHAAHRRGVVHRDLKPENILLVDVEGMRDFVKVLDFGIAKLVRGNVFDTSGGQSGGQGSLTGTGFVPGTPGYIAPEQITGGGDDPRSDLYALGVTWFEMLTARRPFEAESAMKIFLAQLEREAPPVAEVRPGLMLPARVEAVLLSLLARDPSERPSSAEELLSILRDLSELEGVDAAPHVDTPGAGSLSLAPIDALQPDDPTQPALTTPSFPLAIPPARDSGVTQGAARTTPSTGTTETQGLVPVARSTRSSALRALQWAAAAFLVVALGVVAYLGLTNPRMLPPQAHQSILSYLAYRVHLASGENLDEAERAAELLAHPCGVAEAKARLAAARGDLEGARRGYARLVERERFCRVFTHGGVHVIKARAALIELDAREGKRDEAERGLAELLATYPNADADLDALRRARAAIPR